MKVKELKSELNKLHDDSVVEVWFNGFNETIPLHLKKVSAKSNSIYPPFIGVFDITVAPISLTPTNNDDEK